MTIPASSLLVVISLNFFSIKKVWRCEFPLNVFVPGILIDDIWQQNYLHHVRIPCKSQAHIKYSWSSEMNQFPRDKTALIELPIPLFFSSFLK